MEILAMILLQRHRLWKKCSSFPYHKANGNGLATVLEKKPTLIPTSLVSLSQQWKPTQIFYFLVGDGEGGGVLICVTIPDWSVGLKGLILAWRVWSWAEGFDLGLHCLRELAEIWIMVSVVLYRIHPLCGIMQCFL